MTAFLGLCRLMRGKSVVWKAIGSWNFSETHSSDVEIEVSFDFIIYSKISKPSNRLISWLTMWAWLRTRFYAGTNEMWRLAKLYLVLKRSASFPHSRNNGDPHRLWSCYKESDLEQLLDYMSASWNLICNFCKWEVSTWKLSNWWRRGLFINLT